MSWPDAAKVVDSNVRFLFRFLFVRQQDTTHFFEHQFGFVKHVLIDILAQSKAFPRIWRNGWHQVIVFSGKIERMHDGIGDVHDGGE